MNKGNENSTKNNTSFENNITNVFKAAHLKTAINFPEKSQGTRFLL